MSHEFRDAAFECREFTGNTRLLLVYLCEKTITKKSHGLPANCTGVGILKMMHALNTDRPQTVTDCLKELRDAGALVTIHRSRKTALNFVQLHYLIKHKRTKADDAALEKKFPQYTRMPKTPTTLSVAETLNQQRKACKQDNANRASLTTDSVVKDVGFDVGSDVDVKDYVAPLRGETPKESTSKSKTNTKTKVKNSKRPVPVPECPHCAEPLSRDRNHNCPKLYPNPPVNLVTGHPLDCDCVRCIES